MRPGPAGDDPEKELREFVETAVRAGYATVEEVVETAAEVFEETEGIDDVVGFAGRHAVDAEALLAVEATTWPAVTDCDRLDRAFASLDAAGVVARQNFSCCARCAPGDMQEEMDEAEGDGRVVRGYAYFHEQDTEGAVADGTLFVGYGPRDPWDKDTAKFVAVGNEVAAALRGIGLAVEWDGTYEQRIRVKLLWRRRGPWAKPASAPRPAAPAKAGPRPAPAETPPPIPKRPSLSPGAAPDTRGRFAVGAPGSILIVVALLIAPAKKADSPRLALALIAFYVVAVIAARVVVLMPRRRGRSAAKGEDWATAAKELGASVALFRRHFWLDFLRWPLLGSMNDVQYRERDLGLLYHARARAGDADSAVAAANELLKSYGDGRIAAEVRKRLKHAGYEVR